MYKTLIFCYCYALFTVVSFATPVSNAIPSFGFSGAMLSVPRSSIAATSVGHLAFFAGGRLENGSYTDVVDIYNHKTKQWSVSHLSVSRSEVGAGSLANRYALFAGGLDDAFKPLSLVDVYDTRSGTWSAINLSTPRGAPRVMDLGKVAAIIGGLTGDLQYLSNEVDLINADLAISNTSLGFKYPQFGLAMSEPQCGVGMYTSGYQNNRPGERFNDFQPSNRTTVFRASSLPVDINTGAPPFPSPRWGAGGAATNGIFAVGGGHVFGSATNPPLVSVTDRVDIFNARTGKWDGNPLKLSVPRDYPIAEALGPYIIFASGTDKTKEFDILDTRTLSFVNSIKDNRHHPALYILRSDAASVVVDDCLMIVAGGLVYQGRNATASVEMFDACQP